MKLNDLVIPGNHVAEDPLNGMDLHSLRLFVVILYSTLPKISEEVATPEPR